MFCSIILGEFFSIKNQDFDCVPSITGSFLMRYSFSSIDTIAPSKSSASISGNTVIRIRVIMSGLALATRKEITLGPLSPL